MALSFSKTIAVIDEHLCIGCTLCIKACPFDAILGANKQLHAIISAYCTGCKLCIPPCPVDCITMQDNTALHKIEPAVPAFTSHQACIECDKCTPVCPSELQPDLLYKHIKSNKLHFAKTEKLGACTLCEECNKVCPSDIPLAQTFQYGMAVLRIKADKKSFTQASKQRVKLRENRLAASVTEQQTFLATKKDELAKKLASLKKQKR